RPSSTGGRGMAESGDDGACRSASYTAPSRGACKRPTGHPDWMNPDHPPSTDHECCRPAVHTLRARRASSDPRCIELSHTDVRCRPGRLTLPGHAVLVEG